MKGCLFICRDSCRSVGFGNGHCGISRADSAVIAYKLPGADIPLRDLHPNVTSSGGEFDLVLLTDGDLANASPLPSAPAGEKAWIQFEFAAPQTIRGVTYSKGRGTGLFESVPPEMEVKQELEASDDGDEFHVVVTIPGGGTGERTVSFNPVTARFFRFSFTSPEAGPAGPNMVSELVLHTGARVHDFEDKAAFIAMPDLYAVPTPTVPETAAVKKSNVIDLTSRMKADGSLQWTPPAGRWAVLRMGYSLIGAHNFPASPETTGLEVDKLRRTYVKNYINHYLGLYKSFLGDLVRAGAVVVGAKPLDSPSLSDSPTEFRRVAEEAWGSDSQKGLTGKGNIFDRATVIEVLQSYLHVLPDFEYTEPSSDTRLLFVHRRIPNQAEVYWVNNRNSRAETVNATFRVSGLLPELWHPDTGEISPAAETRFKASEGRTTVTLRLDPSDAVFVVFRKPAHQSGTPERQTIGSSPGILFSETELAALEGPWEVHFQPDRGVPEKITFENLGSWSDSPDAGVKYFSGTAAYIKTFESSREWLVQTAGSRIWLDPGSVKNLAEVIVNGKSLGVVWKTPFRVDMKDTLRPGLNTLEIRVTNLWVNRLIGDAQPNAAKKYTYTTLPFYGADSPLQPSGLLGPVRILRSMAIPLADSAAK